MTRSIFRGLRLAGCCSWLFLVACENQSLFKFRAPDQTGVEFINRIRSTDSLNILNYIYFYNGSGVGIGDINNDGLEDLFFAGNQESNQLYLNKGNLKFENISESAGILNDQWCTGVSFVDINADGWLDIYVSVSGLSETNRSNLLYINRGDNTFVEAASEYGIDDKGFSTHAAFFDYDGDEDLDLFVLNHANERAILNTPLPKKVNGEGQSVDRLYRNEGNNHFIDVSWEAGIIIEGYGLGISVCDINQDHWPDIYISNDFLSNDVLYINNRDGTFKNRIAEALAEQTYNGMGNDINDINNDGLPDIIVLDMLPPDPVRAKTMAGSMTYEKFNAIISMGYEPQFMRNTLQLNHGNLNFSEIGRFAGIHRTDWSWSALFVDLDNDAWKDLYITNGYLKDITDKDFIDYDQNLSMFKGKEEAERETLKRIEKLKGVKLSNFTFQNSADLRFQDVGATWGLHRPSFSNGAAYADLDADGDMDLVVNNINDPAFVIENKLENDHFLQVKLSGPGKNLTGIGSKIWVHSGEMTQFTDQNPYRGFMSTVTSRVHFGLGDAGVVDSVKVIWPDGKVTVRYDVLADQRIEMNYSNARALNSGIPVRSVYSLTESEDDPGIDFEQQAAPIDDFKQQPFLPHHLSSRGPVISSGDLDNDGIEDLFIGSQGEGGAHLYLQNSEGNFSEQGIAGPEGYFLVNALFFDADRDAMDELILVYNTTSGESPSGIVRMVTFTEKGPGFATIDLAVFPGIASTVSDIDYDLDGDIDLFIGGGTSPKTYPYSSASYLLENVGSRYIVHGFDIAKGGQITASMALDIDGDEDQDLILTGEWRPVTFMENQHGTFRDITNRIIGENTSAGWWNMLYSGDFDKDGDEDIIAGNNGLNSPYQVTYDQPMQLHVVDFNNNMGITPVITHYVNGNEVILPMRKDILSQNPYLSRYFLTHRSFAETSLEELVSLMDVSVKEVLEVKDMRSVILENKGEGIFTQHYLPDYFQLFPIYSAQKVEEGVILLGNFDQATRIGEGYGTTGGGILKIKRVNEQLSFESYPLDIRGNVRSIESINLSSGNQKLVVGINGKIKLYDL